MAARSPPAASQDRSQLPLMPTWRKPAAAAARNRTRGSTRGRHPNDTELAYAPAGPPPKSR